MVVKPNDATAAKLSADNGGSKSVKFDIVSLFSGKSMQWNGKLSGTGSADAVRLDTGVEK